MEWYSFFLRIFILLFFGWQIVLLRYLSWVKMQHIRCTQIFQISFTGNQFKMHNLQYCLRLTNNRLVNLKGLDNSSAMAELDPKTALAIAMTPGFWLLKPEIEKTFPRSPCVESEQVLKGKRTHHPFEGPSWWEPVVWIWCYEPDLKASFDDR